MLLLGEGIGDALGRDCASGGQRVLMRGKLFAAGVSHLWKSANPGPAS